MKRVFDVARVETVTWFWVLAFRPVLLRVTFLLNRGIFAAIRDAPPPDDWARGRSCRAVS